MTTWNEQTLSQSTWKTTPYPPVPHKIKTPIGLLLVFTHLGTRWLPYTNDDWTFITKQQTAWR